MPSTFRDPADDKSFSEKGYTVARSLLSADDIRRLTGFAASHDSRYSSAFHTTHFSDDTVYKKAVHDLICEVVSPAVAKIMQGYKPIFGNYMIKLPDPAVKMPLHADWTYVDESKYRSISIWVPLVDTDEHNGCIGVIDGSHTITNSMRGPNIKQSSTLEQDAIWAAKYGKLLPMKAGDALIYDHGLLHFSPANKSNIIRPAINLSMVPEEAEIIHYCIPSGSERIEKFIVPSSDFYIHYQNFQRPQIGTAVEFLPRDSVHYIDNRMRFYNLKKVLKNLFS